MRVVDRINEIIKEKGMTKRELARRLIDMDMKAHKTGEVPSESSVYAYLNGNIDIKADMVPYIADALGVCEQDLFTENFEQSRKIFAKFYRQNSNNYNEIIDLLEYLSPKTIEILQKILIANQENTIKLNQIITQTIGK